MGFSFYSSFEEIVKARESKNPAEKKAAMFYYKDLASAVGYLVGQIPELDQETFQRIGERVSLKWPEPGENRKYYSKFSNELLDLYKAVYETQKISSPMLSYEQISAIFNPKPPVKKVKCVFTLPGI